MIRPRCRCAESRIRQGYDWRTQRFRGSVPAPAVHDCIYIERRNELISLAASAATRHAGTHQGAKWSEEFLKAMDVLARAAMHRGDL